MRDDECPLCWGERVAAIVITTGEEPYAETVDMPCRCTEPSKEPEPTPIEELLL